MITFRALRILPLRPYSPFHRCFSRVSIPAPTSSMAEVMNKPPFEGFRREGRCGPGLLNLLHGDSCGLGKDCQCGCRNDMRGTPGYADDSPRDRFHSEAGNIGRCSSTAGKYRGYSLDARSIQSLGLDYIVDSEVINARFDPPPHHLDMNPEEQRLLEVFSVRIIDCGESEYIYGRIEFEVYDNESVSLYERPPSDPELVPRDGTLSLTGPSCCLNADQPFRIILNLKDKNGNPFLDGVANVQYFGVDCYRLEDVEAYDTQRRDYFYGNSASLVLYYTVFYNAVQAKVDVHVLNRDGGDQVYGKVVARYSNYDYSTDEQKKYFQTVLFDKPADNYVEVESGEPIPLSRYMVAVPTTSFLIIEANLWNYDTLKKPDDQLAKDTLLFQPESEGATTKSIMRHNGLGEVRVTVTWGVECESLKPW